MLTPVQQHSYTHTHTHTEICNIYCFSTASVLRCTHSACLLTLLKYSSVFWLRPGTGGHSPVSHCRSRDSPCEISSSWTGFLPILQFSPLSIIPPMPYPHLHLHVLLQEQTGEACEPSKSKAKVLAVFKCLIQKSSNIAMWRHLFLHTKKTKGRVLMSSYGT